MSTFEIHWLHRPSTPEHQLLVARAVLAARAVLDGGPTLMNGAPPANDEEVKAFAIRETRQLIQYFDKFTKDELAAKASEAAP